MRANKKGFTIVELLIVVVVIGILASITIIAFGGITARARDAERKSELNSIARLLKNYETERGGPIYTGSGCGSAGNGSGWFSFSNGGTYPLSVNDCLINAGYTSAAILDPSGLSNCAGLTCYAYMKYTCNGGLDTYVFAHLETLPQSSTDTDSTCAPSADTSQGMNYFVRL